MFVLRFLAVLVLLTVIAGGVSFLLTGNRRYLGLTWRLCRYAAIVALLVFALLVLERTVAVPF